MTKGWKQRASESDLKAKYNRKNPAERYVYDQLRKDGFKPIWAKTGKGYDIYTRKRRIEVKGKDNFTIPNWLAFSGNFLKLGKDINQFWIYIVLGMDSRYKRKKVIKIPPDEILRSLSTRVQYGIDNKQIRRIAKKQGIKLY